jgi:hypothetical protein
MICVPVSHLGCPEFKSVPGDQSKPSDRFGGVLSRRCNDVMSKRAMYHIVFKLKK